MMGSKGEGWQSWVLACSGLDALLYDTHEHGAVSGDTACAYADDLDAAPCLLNAHDRCWRVASIDDRASFHVYSDAAMTHIE